MATWPTTIPQSPTYNGFSSTKVDGRLRTSMSEGPEKVRRRFTATPELLTVQFVMTKAEMALFQTFFDTTLIGGSLTYSWAHPISGTTVTCRIKDMPNYVPLGLHWTVSFTVEVLP